jgi:hypothetical protein
MASINPVAYASNLPFFWKTHHEPHQKPPTFATITAHSSNKLEMFIGYVTFDG